MTDKQREEGELKQTEKEEIGKTLPGIPFLGPHSTEEDGGWEQTWQQQLSKSSGAETAFIH